MATNSIIPFATGNGATVPSDASWAASGVIAQGFQNGVADPALVNKALRQSTATASGFAQFVADYSAQDFTDALSVATMRDNFRIAMAAAQAGAYYAVDVSSTANTVTLVLNPAPVTQTSFISFFFLPAITNTGAATLSLNGNSKALNRRDGTALQAGDLISGRLAHAYYHVPSGTFRMVGAVTSDSSNVNSTTINEIVNSAVVNALILPAGSNTIPSATGSTTKLTSFGTATNNLPTRLSWNSGTSRMTCSISGWFFVEMYLDTNFANGNYGAVLSMNKNGSASSTVYTVSVTTTSGVLGPAFSAQRLIYLTAGDYCEFYCGQNSGTSQTAPVTILVEGRGQ